MTAASIGNWSLLIGTNASPEVLTSLEEVVSLDGFGETSELIDVTNWDTTHLQKEFIGGPAEGDEFTVTCNYVAGASTHHAAIRADKGNTRTFRLSYLGSSPNQTWSGSIVILGWRTLPSLEDQNQVEFSFKITGDLTEAGGG